MIKSKIDKYAIGLNGTLMGHLYFYYAKSLDVGLLCKETRDIH
jgi:hypothetical protein